MILNLPTLLLLFVAGLVGLVGTGLGLTSLALLLFPGQEEIPGEPPPGWRRTADAALHAGNRVALLLLALGWPLLYVTLASYVARISGAMCIYGVTQFASTQVHTTELAWPTALFAFGLYFVLQRVDGETLGAPNRQRNRGVLLLASSTMVATALYTVQYLLVNKGGAVVSCCTTARDLAPGPGFFQYMGLSLLVEQPTLTPYLASSGTLLGLLALAGLFGSRLPVRLLLAVSLVLALGGALALLVMIEAMFGAVSPRLLGLPFHRCLYCLFGEFPDAPLFLAAGVGSACCTLWAAGVAWLADPATSPPARRTVVDLWRASGLLLGASWTMVAFHLVAASWR